MRYDAKCIIVGRKPRGDNTYKTAFVKIFDCENPLSIDVLPREELDFENIREVEFKGFDISYLLEGNDILIDKIGNFDILENKENNTIVISRV